MFRTIFSFADLFASGFSSFENILSCLFVCFPCFAMTIGYGPIPANITKIFEFGFDILMISSAMIFLSFDSLGEK